MQLTIFGLFLLQSTTIDSCRADFEGVVTNEQNPVNCRSILALENVTDFSAEFPPSLDVSCAGMVDLDGMTLTLFSLFRGENRVSFCRHNRIPVL